MSEIDLKKMQDQIRAVARCVSFEQHPMESLMLDFDWSENDMKTMHDVLEHFDNQLSSGGSADHSEIEREFEKKLGLSYQGVKSVMLANWRNRSWADVCISYRDSFGEHPPIEVKAIGRT